jgi:hypothetical protein
MEKQPIYLDNFELALQMKMAGFDKECFFRALNHNFYEPVTRKNYENLHILYGYVKIVATHYFSPACFSGSKETLYLPTLGEIDLPEYISIVREQKSYYVYCNNNLLLQEILNTELPNKNTFKTELEARAHAWIWANQKKEVKNEK